MRGVIKVGYVTFQGNTASWHNIEMRIWGTEEMTHIVRGDVHVYTSVRQCNQLYAAMQLIFND